MQVAGIRTLTFIVRDEGVNSDAGVHECLRNVRLLAIFILDCLVFIFEAGCNKRKPAPSGAGFGDRTVTPEPRTRQPPRATRRQAVR